jgi:hypothetical protein
MLFKEQHFVVLGTGLILEEICFLSVFCGLWVSTKRLKTAFLCMHLGEFLSFPFLENLYPIVLTRRFFVELLFQSNMVGFGYLVPSFETS